MQIVTAINSTSHNPVDMFEAVDVLKILGQDISDVLYLFEKDQITLEDFKEELLSCAVGIIQNLQFVK
jgi:hypothetical protein